MFEFSRQFQLSNASSSSIVTPAYCWATPPLTPSRDSGHASSISTSSNISSLLDEEFGDFEEFVVLDTKVDPPKTIKMTKSKVGYTIFSKIYSGKMIIIYMHIVYVFLKKQIVKNMPPLCLEALFFPELNNCNWKKKN